MQFAFRYKFEDGRAVVYLRLLVRFQFVTLRHKSGHNVSRNAERFEEFFDFSKDAKLVCEKQ
jgi:hypothetical protein